MLDSKLDFLLDLDSNQDKERQRSLNINNLTYDPNRPIYQQFFRLRHFLGEDTSQELFEQLVKSLQEFYPDQDVKKSINQYLRHQKEIDQNRQGYLNQLEKEEVMKSIEHLKSQVDKVSDQIIKEQNKISFQEQKAQTLKAEISQIEYFLKQNQTILQRMHQGGLEQCEYQKQHKKAGQNFQSQRQKLEKETKSHISQFQKQYKMALAEKKRLEDAIRSLKQKRSELEKLKNQRQSIKKQSLQIQNQVENISSQLKIQFQKNLQLLFFKSERKSQKQQEQYQKLQAQMGKLSERSYESSSQILETTQYLSFKEIDNSRNRYQQWENWLHWGTFILVGLSALRLLTGVF